MGEIDLCISHPFRVCIASWKMLPQLCKVLSPSWHHNRIFKRPSTGFSSQLLRDIGDIIRTVNSSGMSPWLCSVSYKISSLLRSSAVWNIMMVEMCAVSLPVVVLP